jgi:hypothetical protein
MGEENTKTITYQKGWRIQTNDELQIKYRKPNTVTTIGRRLEWTGLVRISDNRSVKKLFLQKPE